MSWRRRSFEVLPALRVGGKDLRKSLQTITGAWMLGVVWFSIISGSQMTVFGNLLGFTNRQFGLLSAIGYGAFGAQLISAMMIERTGLRKYPFLFFASIHRLLWLAIAAVPLVLMSGQGAIAAFFALFAVSCVLSHMHIPAWQSWMGDLIPPRIRSRYLANRRIWTIPIQVAVVIAAGLILDYVTVPGAPTTAEAQPVLLWTICGVFAVGAILGTLDILLFFRIREVVSPPLLSHRPAARRGLVAAFARVVVELGRILVDAVRDRRFLHVGLHGALIAFAMAAAGQFFFRNCLQNLGYSKFGTNMVFMVAGPLAALLTIRFWGRLIDRWGRRPVLILATMGVILGPLGWFLIPASASGAGSSAEATRLGGWFVQYFGTATWLAYALGAASCVYGSIMWSGLMLTRFNILLGFSQTAGRSKYIAAAAVFMAIGGFLGGVVGGSVADHFVALQYDANPIRVGPFAWNNWHLTFLLSAAARAVAVFCLIGMPDPGARPLREMVRHFRFNAYNNVLPRLFWPLRALGQGLGRRRKNGNSRQN